MKKKKDHIRHCFSSRTSFPFYIEYAMCVIEQDIYILVLKKNNFAIVLLAY